MTPEQLEVRTASGAPRYYRALSSPALPASTMAEEYLARREEAADLAASRASSLAAMALDNLVTRDLICKLDRGWPVRQGGLDVTPGDAPLPSDWPPVPNAVKVVFGVCFDWPTLEAMRLAFGTDEHEVQRLEQLAGDGWTIVETKDARGEWRARCPPIRYVDPIVVDPHRVLRVSVDETEQGQSYRGVRRLSLLGVVAEPLAMTVAPPPWLERHLPWGPAPGRSALGSPW